MNGLLFLTGIILIYFSSKWLIGHAVRLGTTLTWTETITGFIVIGLGTSAPEIAISFYSLATHHTDMLVGNITGSNIANCLLVFGAGLVLTRSQLHKPSAKETSIFITLTLLFVLGLLLQNFSRFLSIIQQVFTQN